jgi:quercetin dioxygenase-like cupin family protein
MIEITEGEVILRTEKLDVTLLADVEHLGAVEVRALRGWGMSPLHVHARHAEALFVLEGELMLRLEDRVHRVGPGTWAFVPPEVVHSFEVTGGVGSTEPPESGGAGFAGAGAGSDEPARFVAFHAPCSGFGDYVRAGVPFDQQPPPEYASGDPGLAVVRRAGGSEGEKITDRPERRATVLIDADELVVSEFFYGPGERGAKPHVHHDHADAFLVLDGELGLTVGDGRINVPSRSLALLPPDVVHGFDNDGAESMLVYNFHLPASGFADYLRGRNPGFDQHDPPADGGADPASAVLVRLPEVG